MSVLSDIEHQAAAVVRLLEQYRAGRIEFEHLRASIVREVDDLKTYTDEAFNDPDTNENNIDSDYQGWEE